MLIHRVAAGQAGAGACDPAPRHPVTCRPVVPGTTAHPSMRCTTSVRAALWLAVFVLAVVAGDGVTRAAEAAGQSGAAAPLQAVGLQPVVDRFYPTDRLMPAGPVDRQSCHAVVSSTASGEPLVVVAAYTDRTAGAIRVLRRGPDGAFAVAADSPPAWLLPGPRCSMQLEDLEADGRPEVFVYFEGRRSATGWVVRWDDAGLTNLTPTRSRDGRDVSLLLDPVVYDLAHEGPLRVIAARETQNTAPGVRASSPAYVYRPGPSGLVEEQAILAVMGFRADVAAASNLRVFRLVTDSSPPLTLRVINGARGGTRRVESLRLELNYRPLEGAGAVNAATEFTTLTVPDPQIENRLTAALTGAPDAIVIVLVEDATPR